MPSFLQVSLLQMFFSEDFFFAELGVVLVNFENVFLAVDFFEEGACISKALFLEGDTFETL